MNVNSVFTVIVRNRFLVLGGILMVFISTFFIASSFTRRSETDLFLKRVNLTIREIGHHLLLHAGDSASRVLPVKEKSKGVFLLEFENEFVFKPDTLVALTQRFLAKADLSNYTVTVYECFKPDIIYGFQINPPNNNIKPCRGRSQPKGCYTIEIAFANFDDFTAEYATGGLIFGGFLFLSTLVLVSGGFGRNNRAVKNERRESSVENIKTALPCLGKFAFDLHNHKLIFDNEIVSLTEKECKILELLNRNFGHLTSREDLIREVWLNEGVITGRSLDMFVSKLRKKLGADPAVRITNVHGQGYRLELITPLTDEAKA